MKLAFIINSLNSFRHLAPIIKGGLERGIDIECWHNCSIDKKGAKGYLYPDVERSPFSEKQYPSLKNRAFHKKEEMQEAMVSRKDISCFVSQYYPEIELIPSQIQQFSATWCTIMHVHDSYLEMKRVDPAAMQQGITRRFFPYSASYFTKGEQYFAELMPKGRTYFAKPNTHVHPIGCAMVEPGMLQIDKGAIRKKFGIPKGKNILLYLPFTFNFDASQGHKSSFAWQAAFAGLDIERKAAKEFDNRTLRKESQRKRLARNAKYLKKILPEAEARKWLLKGWREAAVIASIRQFCDRNNLHLVVKPRIKFDFAETVRRKADLVVDFDDESQYCPSMLQELYAICDLSIGYFTTAVLESIYCNVPHINLHYPDFLSSNPHRKFWYTASEGSIFNFHGAVYDTMIPDFINEFGNATIDSYRMDQAKRTAYMERYTGLADASPADRFYAALTQEH